MADPIILDYYEESNRDYALQVSGGTNHSVGQSFYGDGNELAQVEFFIQKSNSPTGYAYAKLYAHSGTFGTSSIPTGSALATSEGVDVSTLGAYALVAFTFTDGYILGDGTPYVICLEYTGGDTTDKLYVGCDSSSPTHEGNASRTSDMANWFSRAEDMIFYVYVYEASADCSVNIYDSTSVTDTTTCATELAGIAIDDAITTAESLSTLTSDLLISTSSSISTEDTANIVVEVVENYYITVHESITVSDLAVQAISDLEVAATEVTVVEDSNTSLFIDVYLNAVDTVNIDEYIIVTNTELSASAIDTIIAGENTISNVSGLSVSVYTDITTEDLGSLSVEVPGVLYISAADTATTVETVTAELEELRIVVFSSVSTVDAGITDLLGDIRIDKAELITVLDTASASILQLLVNTFDANNITESTGSELSGPAVSVYDTAEVSDNIESALNDSTVSVYDNIILSDVIILSAELLLAVSDIITADDNTTCNIDVTVWVSDSTGVEEIAATFVETGIPTVVVSVDDSVILEESITSSTGWLLVDIQESVKVVEDADVYWDIAEGRLDCSVEALAAEIVCAGIAYRCSIEGLAPVAEARAV
ncbi:MAG: hypothetical protein WDA47_01670 [Bacilli bacterium]